MLSVWTLVPLLFVLVVVDGDLLYRLPKTSTPKSYDLKLTVSDPIQDDTFQGHVKITFTNTDNSDSVTLNARQDYITIAQVVITPIKQDGTDDTPLTNCTSTTSTKYADAEEIKCVQQLTKGTTYSLYIDYTANFTTEDMLGFYKSTGTEMLLATQFEPIHARRVFPCFDEPSFKAEFTLTITHPKEYTALSNTAGSRDEKTDAATCTTTFKPTPKMSSYLLAFVISKFEAATVEPASDRKYDYKVYARTNAQSDMGTATKYGPKLIDTMGKWIGMEYDTLGNTQAYQVAIPDFAAGAMENWGLITYREADLLDESEKTSRAAKQRIIAVIAHELSHQWFGDYVTADWWSNLWLNEGFAAYFQHHIPSKTLGFTEEDFELEKQFISVFQSALKADTAKNSLPLSSDSTKINTLTDINEKFDDITYNKGSSVIRMISFALGQDKFKEALQKYLKDNANSNGDPNKLLGLLQPSISGTNVDWKEWFFNAGFPLVTAALKDGKILLTQEAFDREDKTQWNIPITYTTGDKADFDHFNYMLVGKEDIQDNKKWAIFNLKGVGFFRVNYDNELWGRLIGALKGEDKDKIDVLNRAQLIDDIYNIAKIGKVTYQRALELTDYLKNEQEYYPWQTALKEFSFMLGKLDNDEQKTLKSLIYGYMKSAFPKGVKPEKHVDYLKEALIKEWLCELGDGECIEEAKTNFEAYKKYRSIDPDLRGVALCYGLKHSAKPGNDSITLEVIYKGTPSSLEQNAILNAFGCSEDNDVLTKFLNEVVYDHSVIRKQDAATAIISVFSNNDKGLTAALTFMADSNNFKKIDNRCKGLNSITRIVSGLATRVRTDEQRAQLKKILNDNANHSEIKLIKDQVEETMKVNEEWFSLHKVDIQKGLDTLTKNNSPVSFTPLVLISIISLITMIINLM